MVGEKKKQGFTKGGTGMGRKPVDPSKKRKILSVTLNPAIIQWVKEWAAKRDRSVSWAIDYFIQERRNRELAELHLGQKVVRRRL